MEIREQQQRDQLIQEQQIFNQQQRQRNVPIQLDQNLPPPRPISPLHDIGVTPSSAPQQIPDDAFRNRGRGIKMVSSNGISSSERIIPITIENTPHLDKVCWITGMNK